MGENKKNTKTTTYRIILLVLTVISVLGTAFGFKPVFVLMLSQACIAIVLPITIASIIYLTCKKELMNDHANRLYDNVLLSLIMLFSVYISSLGIRGLGD